MMKLKLDEYGVPKELVLDWERANKNLVAGVRKYFRDNKIKTGVIGVSGGSDSTLAITILAEAIGRENVYSFQMHEEGVTPYEDRRDAQSIVEHVELPSANSYSFEMKEIFDRNWEFMQRNRTRKFENDIQEKIAKGNVKARTRMATLYDKSKEFSGIVVGTDDKSEFYLGYFTKYGDSGVDINILESLYKTQVKGLGLYTGLPESNFKKSPSPRLWANHDASEEMMGMGYDTVDMILSKLLDYNFGDTMHVPSTHEIAGELGVAVKKVKWVQNQIEATEHKRQMPKYFEHNASKT